MGEHSTTHIFYLFVLFSNVCFIVFILSSLLLLLPLPPPMFVLYFTARLGAERERHF